MNPLPRIVYCHCAFAQVLPRDVKHQVFQELLVSGVEFDCVPDLCQMSAHRDPLLRELSAGPPVRIAACYPRAVQGLFVAAGTPLPPSGAEVVNMRVSNASTAVTALLRPAGDDEAKADTP
jgi:hypothetical protein